MEGLTLFQAGRLLEADTACERVLRQLGGQPDALHLKALILHAQGLHAEALDKVDKALTATSNFSMSSTRGLILKALGRWEEAVFSLQQAVELNPQPPELWLNLAVAQRQAGLLDKALDSAHRAVRQGPGLAAAHDVLGDLLIAHRDAAGAEQAWRAAVALQPTLVDAWVNLGSVCWAQRRLDDALLAYRQALALDPGQVSALDNLAIALREANRYEEAQAAARNALALQPNAEREIHAALMLPVVLMSGAEILAVRARFESELDRLTATLAPVDALTPRLFCDSVFQLAYHAYNDRELRLKLSRLYVRLYPSLTFRATHLSCEPQPGCRRRVGFFSAFLHDHPVAQCFAATIERLSKDPRFDIYLISPDARPGGLSDTLHAGFGGTWVPVLNEYGPARTRIAELALDVLVYQDIGMEPTSYFLAHARLARVQCAMGGHPETTGIPAIDHFLSTDGCEPPDADQHYVENLVRLPAGVARYRHPTLPAQFKGRVELGLPAEGRLYICPMMLQKLHPDFDAAMAGILRADPQGHVILFEHLCLPWRASLERRLVSSIAAGLRERLHFLPWIQDKADFLAVNAHASVVLDPFHFGIGSTAISTFAVGTPVVTWPGEFMRGRGGLDYCRVLGLDDCIATDQADYVERAVAIASDPQRRDRLSSLIERNKHRFYDKAQVADDLANFLIGLRPAAVQPPAAA
jgi:predicted O-linked N-acetylglucosamine transferase (SPINDLY family)